MKAIIRPCKNWKLHSCPRSGLQSKFRLRVQLRQKFLTPPESTPALQLRDHLWLTSSHYLKTHSGEWLLS